MSCDYDSYIQAYTSIKSSDDPPNGSNFANNAYLFKPKPCPEYKLDIPHIIDSIKDYLNPKVVEDNCFGQQIYEHMIRYYRELKDGTSIFSNHMGNCAVIVDHKKLMTELLKKLVRMRIIEEKHISEYSNILDKAITLRNLVIKYNLTLNSSLIKIICDLIKKIKLSEYSVLSAVVSELILNGGK